MVFGAASEIASTKISCRPISFVGVKVRYSAPITAAGGYRPNIIAATLGETMGAGSTCAFVNNAGIHPSRRFDHFRSKMGTRSLSIHCRRRFHTTRWLCRRCATEPSSVFGESGFVPHHQHRFQPAVRCRIALHGLSFPARAGIVGLTKVAAWRTAEEVITSPATVDTAPALSTATGRGPSIKDRCMPGTRISSANLVIHTCLLAQQPTTPLCHREELAARVNRCFSPATPCGIGSPASTTAGRRRWMSH